MREDQPTPLEGISGDPVAEPVPRPGPSTARVLATASLILTVAALASRLLGWIRLLVIGSQFGASRELDAYFAAFRIPDAIFQLVVAGALSAALIPVFASYRARGQEAEAWRLASSVINLVVIALAGLSLVMAIFAPVLVPIVAPGFDAPTTDLTIRMTRVMLLSPVLIGMGAVVSGILNSYERFAVPSLAPLAYNLVIILAAIFLAPIMGVEGLAVGVAIGSLAHLVIQLPELGRVGQRYDLTIGLRHPGVRKVAFLMGPRMLGLAAGQINFIVSTILASGLPAGSLTAYNYAFQLSQIPVGVLGVSVAVALFPTLSRDAALGHVGEIRRQVATSLRVLIFIAAPLTAAMIVLADPITSVFFQYGLFSEQSVLLTANALAFFAIGLVAHIVVHVLTRAFYAMQDTRTPVLWAIVAVAINVPLMAWLVGPMGVAGLALALSISASLEVMGLLLALHRRIESIEGAAVLRSAARSAVGAGAAALTMLGGLTLVETWLPALLQGGISRVLVVVVLGAAGAAIFLLVASALRSPEIALLRNLMRRRKRAPRMIKVRPATDADHAAWQELLARCAAGDFLHDWSWADVAAFDGQPQRRFVAKDEGELVAIAAAQVRHLPLGRSFWYVAHGPVMDYDHPHAAERLRAMAIGLREAARRDRAIAVKLEPRLERRSKPTSLFAKLHHASGTLQVSQTRLVELADDETLLAGFDKDTRYAVRRAEREGVVVAMVTDAGNLEAIDALHGLVLETQRRAGFPKPPLQRYRVAWRALASAGRATIFEARREEELLASAMLVVEGDRSFYLFSGSRREERGQPKRYASYALQMAMMRHARASGATTHDLWGIAPEDAAPDHPWYGVGLFKKGFGGRVVVWAGTWDIVVDRTLYRMRAMVESWRATVRELVARWRPRDR